MNVNPFRHDGYDANYTFFFDESENSHEITFKPDGSSNLFDEYTGDAFIGVFCGVPNDRLDEVRETFLKLENIIREIYHLNDGIELKSSIFKRKQFRFGASSFDKNTRKAMFMLFRELRNSKLHINITYTSKMEAMIRQMFSRIELPKYAVENLFYANMVRFFKYYFDQNDFQKIFELGESNPEALKNYMQNRFHDLAEYGRDKPDMAMIVRGSEQNIMTLEDCLFLPDIKQKYTLPYEKSFQWFAGYIKSCHIDLSHISLIIDGIEGQYSEESIGPIQHSFQDSKSEVMLRVCDLLAGFISKMIWSLYCSTYVWKTKQDFLNARDNELLTIDDEWYDIDLETFHFYQDVASVLYANRKKTAVSWAYADPAVSFHAFVYHIASFREYSKFASKSNRWHKMVHHIKTVKMLKSRGRKMKWGYIRDTYI